MKNTSVSLGPYFEEFVQKQVAKGRYQNVSEVLRAGLRLLEDENAKREALYQAIQVGASSPIFTEFDFEENLRHLKDTAKQK